MELEVDFPDGERLAAAFSNTKPLLDAELLTAMTRSTAQMQGEIQAAMPVWQGTARASVTQTATAQKGEVGTSLLHAIVQGETGRAAGAAAPPPGSLLAWMASKGIPADAEYVVARSISRRGIPARRLFSNALARNRGAINAEFENAVRRFVAKLQARL